MTLRMDGMDQLTGKLEQLGEKAAKVAAEALYEGAGVVADAVSRGVQGIRTEPFRYAKDGQKRKPSPEEKAILMAARKGVSKFRNNGTSVQTSVGMQKAGYAQLGSKTKPIPVIANAINSGTSFMEKQPFFRQAASQAKGQAQAAIEKAIEKRVNEINIG